MKAFLLAAGVGSRLGSLTAQTPKCLLPVAGRPLMDYWFDAFAQADVTHVLVNLHHHAGQVREYLRGQEGRFTVETLYEERLLGSAGTLRQAWEFVEGEQAFFIVYADNFAVCDLRELAAFHERQQHPALSLLLYETDEPERCGIVELDANSRVIAFEEKPRNPRSRLANAGIHVAGQALLEYLPADYPSDLGFHVLPKLVGKMYGMKTSGPVQDIGTPEGYARAQRLAANFTRP